MEIQEQALLELKVADTLFYCIVDSPTGYRFLTATAAKAPGEYFFSMFSTREKAICNLFMNGYNKETGFTQELERDDAEDFIRGISHIPLSGFLFNPSINQMDDVVCFSHDKMLKWGSGG